MSADLHNSHDTLSTSSENSRSTSPHSISSSANIIPNIQQHTNGLISPSVSLHRQGTNSQYSSPQLNSVKANKSQIDWNNTVLPPTALQYTQTLLNQSVNNNSEHNKQLCKFFSTQLGYSYIMNKLLNGTILLKHGSRGSPHYRYIWCSPDLKSIMWGDIQKKKIHGTLQCSTIDSIICGQQTKTFIERAPKHSDPLNCFSLVTAQRTLDLEALSYSEREVWALCFNYLIDYTKYINTKPSSSTNNNQIIKNTSLINTLELLCDISVNNSATSTNEKSSTYSMDSNSDTAISSQTSPVKRLSQSAVSPRADNLVMSLDEAKKKAARLEADIEISKENNRKLLITSAKKMIKLQEQLDVLIYENDILKQKLPK